MGWLTGIEPATPGATILNQIKETSQFKVGFSELETGQKTTGYSDAFTDWMAPFIDQGSSQTREANPPSPLRVTLGLFD